MREDITFGSSSACSERVAGPYKPHFLLQASQQSAALPRAYPAPGRQGKANSPYSGTAFLNNPLYPLYEGDQVSLVKSHILKVAMDSMVLTPAESENWSGI